MAGLDPAIHLSSAQISDMDGARTLPLRARGRPWHGCCWAL